MPRDSISIEHSTLNYERCVFRAYLSRTRTYYRHIAYVGLCPSRDGNCTHKEVDSIGYDSLSILSEVQTQSRYVSVEINILLLDFRLALLTS